MSYRRWVTVNNQKYQVRVSHTKATSYHHFSTRRHRTVICSVNYHHLLVKFLIKSK